MTANADDTRQAHDTSYVWQLTSDAAAALERAASALEDIGQGLPPREQALAYDLAADQVREAWDAVAEMREHL